MICVNKQDMLSGPVRIVNCLFNQCDCQLIIKIHALLYYSYYPLLLCKTWLNVAIEWMFNGIKLIKRIYIL